MLTAVLLGLLLLGLPLVGGPPAGAEPLPLDLAMVPGQGLITLRDAEEPTALPDPLTLDGMVETDTGAISDGSLVATPIDFALPVPEFNTTASITATFTQLDPGTMTGTIDETGLMSVRLRVKVDLHVEVGPEGAPFLTADCTASPITLELSSSQSYDWDTRRVTLIDEDFSVPAVTSGGACNSLVAPEINATLQGGGHALELVLEGDIPVIPVVGDEVTTTTLTVTPAVTRDGGETTLQAQVAVTDPTPPAETPTGFVQFRNADALLETVPIDGAGLATVTTTFPLGHHSFTARYMGDPVHARSLSATVDHTVAAAPTVEMAMAGTVMIAGLPRTATATITNPAELGALVEDVRLDVVLGRTSGGASFLTPDAIDVERWDGSAWVPVTLTTIDSRTMGGSIPLDGLVIAPGGQAQVRLRVAALDVGGTPHETVCAAAQPTCPGPARITVELVQLDGEGGEQSTLAGVTHPFTLVEESRRGTSLSLVPAPRPHTLRQGYAVELVTRIAPIFGSIQPLGRAEFFLDGERVGVRAGNTPYEDGSLDWLPVTQQVVQGTVLLPPDIEPGSHTVAVRYSGDLVYGPSDVHATITVLPAAGHPFVCQAPSVLGIRSEFGANVVFDVDVPALATAGSTLVLDVAEARLLFNRPHAVNPLPTIVNDATVPVGPTSPLRGVSFTLGEHGTGAATSMTRQGAATTPQPNPAPPDQVDQTLSFHDPTASIVVQGDPGDVVPVELDEVLIDHAYSTGVPVPLQVRCTPVGGSLVVGEVEVAGTSVSVSSGLVREGVDEVVVEARTFPVGAAGMVSFSSDRDGALGAGVVGGGVASLVVGGLSPGVHVVTAAFDAADPAVPDTAGTATVVVSYSPRRATEVFVVAARTDFTGSADRDDVVADAAALDGGQSRAVYLGGLSRTDASLIHVVDGLYRDTLGRAGDPDGVAFWVGRLRGGWSVARVAATFYSSNEYVARVGGTDVAWVGDLYRVLLGREADGPGLAYWVEEIPPRGRGAVALGFFQAPESARARVVALYERFLGRAPSQADRDFWAPQVIRRGDLVLAVHLAASTEYGRRADTRFPQI